MKKTDQITGVINTPITLAERLKERRLELQLTQEDVAKMAGVTQGTIGNLETGDRKNPRELLAIARAVKLRPEWLKTGKGPKEIENIMAALRPSPLLAQESQNTSLSPKEAPWPFGTITPLQWQALHPAVQKKAEAIMLSYLSDFIGSETEKTMA
jgi:transcriptional regulator with XRE-family HTH domain